MLEKLATFLNALNRNVWAGVFAVLGVAVGIASLKNKDLAPSAAALLAMAATAFNGKE